MFLSHASLKGHGHTLIPTIIAFFICAAQNKIQIDAPARPARTMGQTAERHTGSIQVSHKKQEDIIQTVSQERDHKQKLCESEFHLHPAAVAHFSPDANEQVPLGYARY